MKGMDPLDTAAMLVRNRLQLADMEKNPLRVDYLINQRKDLIESLEVQLRGREGLCDLVSDAVTCRYQRGKLLENSFLGQLQEATLHLGLLLEPLTGETEYHRKPFKSTRGNKLWRKLRVAIRKGDMSDVMYAMNKLLSFATHDMMRQEFPPLVKSLSL